jgi:uncharacterized membrane protein
MLLRMLSEGPPVEEVGGGFLSTIEIMIANAALVIEILAVLIIIAGTIVATAAYAWMLIQGEGGRLDGYERYKIRLGRALLLGLEILVAADIVRTVALEPSLTNVAVLGILVLIRTFLSWSLVVEIEHRWPWRLPVAAHAEQPTPTPGAPPPGHGGAGKPEA